MDKNKWSPRTNIPNNNVNQSCQKDNIARQRQPYEIATISNPSDSKVILQDILFESRSTFKVKVTTSKIMVQH